MGWDEERNKKRFLGMDIWHWVTLAAVATCLLIGAATARWVPCPNGSCFDRTETHKGHSH